MFEVWILIFTGSGDIIIRFEHVVWSNLIGQQLGAPYMYMNVHQAVRLYTRYDLQELGYARHCSGCPVSLDEV